jgi:hypothetical protein
MNLISLGRDCGDRREGCTVAGGVTESGIAWIVAFLQVAPDRVAKGDSSMVYMEIHARKLQDGRIFAKVEFVRYCVEYLYSLVIMGLELYLAV